MCKVIEDMVNEAFKQGFEEGLKEGTEKGLEQGVALRMLKAEKYPLEEIAAISGMSLEDVKKLQTYQP